MVTSLWIAYTEDVQTHRTVGTVGTGGKLVLEDLPFAPGENVEVLILSKQEFAGPTQGSTLEGSVLEYLDPFEPVATEDWEASR